VTTLSTQHITTENEPRKEHRFLVNESVARLALRTAATYLPLDRDDRPYQWSTTTYCDTYDWAVLKAEKTGHATQLRLREYHRTRPNQVFAGESLFLEMKDDSPDAGMKERYIVPTTEMPAYLRGERTNARERPRAAHGRAREEGRSAGRRDAIQPHRAFSARRHGAHHGRPQPHVPRDPLGEQH